MFKIETNEPLNAATPRILDALRPKIEQVKNPAPGEITQTLWISTPTEDYARQLTEHLKSIVEEATEVENAGGGWAQHLAGRYRLNITANWPSRTKDRTVVEVSVVPAPRGAF